MIYFSDFGSTVTGRLDSYTTNLWSAHGVDLLRTAAPYSLDVFTTVQTSIPFAGASIDTAALLAAAPTSGTCAAFQDQTQTGSRYFGSGTASKQPQIVSGSAFLGSLQFDGAADGINTPDSFGGVSGATIFMRGRLRSTPSTGVILEHSSNYNSNDAFIVYYDTSLGQLMVATHQNTGARYAQSRFNVTITTEAVFCFRFDRSQATGAAQCVLFVNGVKQVRAAAGAGETSPVPSGNFGSAQLFLGARNAGTDHSFLDVKNLAIYSSALSDADCTAISGVL